MIQFDWLRFVQIGWWQKKSTTKSIWFESILFVGIRQCAVSQTSSGPKLIKIAKNKHYSYLGLSHFPIIVENERFVRDPS